MEATDEQNAIQNGEALKSAMVWCTFAFWAVRLWDREINSKAHQSLNQWLWSAFHSKICFGRKYWTALHVQSGDGIDEEQKLRTAELLFKSDFKCLAKLGSPEVGTFLHREKWSMISTDAGVQQSLALRCFWHFLESAGTLGFIAWSGVLSPSSVLKDTEVRFVPDNFTPDIRLGGWDGLLRQESLVLGSRILKHLNEHEAAQGRPTQSKAVIKMERGKDIT